MLGVSERTFRRHGSSPWAGGPRRDRLRDEEPEGLRDRRIGKPSSRRAAAAEILRMLGLYEERGLHGEALSRAAQKAARLHEYPDGRLAIFHGPHRLVGYDPAGNPLDDAKLAA
jgi:hypothetical protein